MIQIDALSESDVLARCQWYQSSSFGKEQSRELKKKKIWSEVRSGLGSGHLAKIRVGSKVTQIPNFVKLVCSMQGSQPNSWKFKMKHFEGAISDMC